MLNYLKTKLFLMIVLKSFTYSCSCGNKSHVTPLFSERNNIKRDLDYEDYKISTESQPQSFDDSDKSNIVILSNNDTVAVNKTTSINGTVVELRRRLEAVNEEESIINKAATVINQTVTMITETIISANEKFNRINSTRNHLKEICAFYEDVEQFDLYKMADVWESKYYRTFTKLPCIRIHIKRTTIEERQYYLTKYGTFNGSLDWNYTIMEIKSKENEHVFRRQHFLNGFYTDRGVLDNVIILRHRDDTFKLLEETTDQWLVVKNLLLMRDCDNGEVIVFSKVPNQPRIEDLADALEIFGEETMNGTMVCEGSNT